MSQTKKARKCKIVGNQNGHMVSLPWPLPKSCKSVSFCIFKFAGDLNFNPLSEDIVELVGHKETTIAVLPFRFLGDAEHMSPVINGLTEDLIINFSKFIGLSVISQYSTQHIADATDIGAISRLGADYIITGTFRPLGDNFRIGVQLIRTRDNTVVFAGNHDETLESILSTQDAITQQMVSVLQRQIDHDLLSYSYKKSSVDLAAYENWLLGKHLLKKGTVESDAAAREHFEAALRIDPGFARAYSGISLSYFNEWSCQLWDRWEVSQKGAHEFALKAIELDENDYISLAVLGRTYLYLGDYDKSELFLRKSLRMNPNDADNLIQIAFYLVYLGHTKEGEQLYLRAKTLNPLHPEVYLPYGSFIYFELGDFKKSVALGEKVKASVWTDFSAYMAAAYYHLAEWDKMHHFWQKYLVLFTKNINGGKQATDKEAMDWQITVNPYKGKSHLEPFWKFMGKNAPVPRKSRPSQQITTGSFIHNGELWNLEYANQSIILKDAKGFHDIAKLLQHPEKQIHCTELMGTFLDNPGDVTLDTKSIGAYKKRILELQSLIREAEDVGDNKSYTEIREEYESLLDHLSKAMGTGGQARKIGSSLEKARSAVTWRIRSTIKKIEKAHPQLGKHLSNSIKTGTFCSYVPESTHSWSI
ncbi:tetratricopeptide repeat protein [Ulvibacterium sp.]|uniref:tetratricopeptide repeat protein n=1 Tax=Ulvibacterium sp. TaxID=2665914 RepID=UPI003BAA0A2B